MTASRRATLLTVSMATAAAFASCEVVAPVSQKSVEEALTCQCGCGLTVHTCNHLQCSFAVPVRDDIAKSLAAGTSAEDVLASYVSEYGEKVLSAPTMRGFNLVAWYGPYVAILLGGIGIFVAARRWQRVAATTDTSTPAASLGAPGDEVRRRLERELEEFDA